MPNPQRPRRPETMDPQPFQRWLALVSSWICQTCGCALNVRGVLRPECRTCTHIHLPPASRERTPHD
jgi:hypothetical protein